MFFFVDYDFFHTCQKGSPPAFNIDKTQVLSNFYNFWISQKMHTCLLIILNFFFFFRVNPLFRFFKIYILNKCWQGMIVEPFEVIGCSFHIVHNSEVIICQKGFVWQFSSFLLSIFFTVDSEDTNQARIMKFGRKMHLWVF